MSQKTPEELLLSRWCRPSISIVDIKCQEHGRDAANKTSFCVIPREATGKVGETSLPQRRVVLPFLRVGVATACWETHINSVRLLCEG